MLTGASSSMRESIYKLVLREVPVSFVRGWRNSRLWLDHDSFSSYPQFLVLVDQRQLY
jgi:hypothetical protein